MTSDYIKGLNDEVKAYYRVLSPEFPGWLTEYIDTQATPRRNRHELGVRPYRSLPQ